MVESICSLDWDLSLGLRLGLGLRLSLCMGLRLKFANTAVPLSNLPWRLRWSGGWGRCTPLGSRRSTDTRSLISLGVDILRLRGWGSDIVLTAACQLALKELQASFNMNVGRIQISSTAVSVKSICNLVVAGFILEKRLGCQILAFWEGTLTKVPRSYHTSEM